MATAQTQPAQRRFRPQFGLRTLLLVVAACAVWIGDYVHRAHRQHDAIAAIRRAGGTVQTVPVAPTWVRNLLGQEYFVKPVAVAFDAQKPATDDDLAALRGMPNLEVLYLGGNFTDAGIEYASHLTSLKVLGLTHVPITDAGMVHLSHLTNLRELRLVGSRVSGSGLVYLKGMKRLRVLCLSGTRIDGSGLWHLDALPALEQLSLAFTQIEDADLEHLKGLGSLEHLDLAGTRITDAGLEHLKHLTNLRYLRLELSLCGAAGPPPGPPPGMSDAALADLQTALPQLIIDPPPATPR